jgi:hypothetical protein
MNASLRLGNVGRYGRICQIVVEAGHRGSPTTACGSDQAPFERSVMARYASTQVAVEMGYTFPPGELTMLKRRPVGMDEAEVAAAAVTLSRLASIPNLRAYSGSKPPYPRRPGRQPRRGAERRQQRARAARKRLWTQGRGLLRCGRVAVPRHRRCGQGQPAQAG